MGDIIVIGSNYATALGIVKSLGEAGFGVRFLALANDCLEIIKNSRYVRNSVYSEDEPHSILNALEKLRGEDDRLLIIPTSDSSALFLDEYADSLSDHYLIPNINGESGAVSRMMNKEIQKKLAESCGLNVAKGKAYSSDDAGIENALSEAVFPCVTKASASAECLRSKDIFRICSNEEELRAALLSAREKNCPSVIVEQYLRPEKEYASYGVAYNGTVLMPACVDTLRSGNGSHKGVTAEGVMFSAERLGEDKAKFESFVKATGLNGLFCIDIIKCQGRLYFIELNLRYGASGDAVTLGGANLPAMLARTVTENVPIDSSAAMDRDVHFINEKVELDDYRVGFLSWKDYKDDLSKDIAFFIRDERDPGPWQQYKKLEMRKRLARFIRGARAVKA